MRGSAIKTIMQTPFKIVLHLCPRRQLKGGKSTYQTKPRYPPHNILGALSIRSPMRCWSKQRDQGLLACLRHDALVYETVKPMRLDVSSHLRSFWYCAQPWIRADRRRVHHNGKSEKVGRRGIIARALNMSGARYDILPWRPTLLSQSGRWQPSRNMTFPG